MSDYQLTCLVHDPQRTAHEVTSSRRLNVGVLQLVHHRTVGAQADVGAQFGTLTQMAPVVRRHLQQQQSVATFCNCCHTVTKCTLLFNIRLKSPRIRCRLLDVQIRFCLEYRRYCRHSARYSVRELVPLCP